eukprot:1196059-Prorocentrum_minimum.AAC.3
MGYDITSLPHGLAPFTHYTSCTLHTHVHPPRDAKTANLIHRGTDKLHYRHVDFQVAVFALLI